MECARIIAGRWRHERDHELHAGACEVRGIARDHRQIVHPRDGRDLLVQGVLMVGCSQPPPHLCGVRVEVEHVVRMVVKHRRQPALQQARLLGIAAQPDEFDAAPELADRDDRQIDRVVRAGNATEEVDDAWQLPEETGQASSCGRLHEALAGSARRGLRRHSAEARTRPGRWQSHPPHRPPLLASGP